MIEWISKAIKRPRSAITLVELMIAMGLATLVAGAVVGIMATGSRMWKGGVSKLKTIEQESVLLTRITKELEEASKIYWADGAGIAFYRQGYETDATATPHGCTGTNLNHANCSNPNAVPWDTRYAGGPYWRGLSSDVVWFYTKSVGGRMVIVRKVTDGFTPTITRSPETIISDPDIDIAKLRFTYWNFMGYFFGDRINRFSPIPPGTTDVTPDIRVVQAKITPSDYPQNIWKTMEWTRNIPGGTAYTQYARVIPDGNYMTGHPWWDDNTAAPGSSFGCTTPCTNASGTACNAGELTASCGWTTSLSSPGAGAIFNPWSGLNSLRVGPASSYPNLGMKTAQFTGATSPLGVTSANLLYYNNSTPAGPFSLAKQPTVDTDTPNGCQLDITLGARKKVIGAATEESECTGYITIAGTDPANASISTTMEFFGCGFTLTTPNIFKTVYANGITTTGLFDEVFSDASSATPTITINNPNKKVYLLAHIYLDPYPLDNVRILVLRFLTGTADPVTGSNWRYAYWAHPNDRYADNNSNTTMDINELTSNLSADGRDMAYMGPLPPVGGWTVLGVPVSYPGLRIENTADNLLTLTGMGISVFHGRAYIDKVTVGGWGAWTSFATSGGSSLSSLGEANYIQFRGELATSAPTTSPTLSDTTIEHGKQGGLTWTRTSDEDWMQGTFSNTVPSYGDVALWRTSGPDNLTQGEIGPITINPNLQGWSYYGVVAPGYGAGSIAGVWQKIKWTRSGETGWAVDFSAWGYRKRITLTEAKGLVRFRDVVIVDIPPGNVNANGSDIRITTLNGTEKPFRYLGKVDGTNHRIMFLGNCPGMGTFTYFVYYGNAAATMPTYSKSSTPALPAGTGIVGNYFNYNVRYRDAASYYPFFPTSTVATTATNVGPSPGSYQGSFASQRRDNNINFTWGSGSPGTGVTSDYFSVGWRGWMFADTDTTWTFRIERDDDASHSTAAGYNARVWLNNTSVVSTTSANDNIFQEGSTALGIGMHQLMVNYSDYSGTSNIRIRRSHATLALQDIPTADLYPNWGGNAWEASNWQFVDPAASPPAGNNGYGNVNTSCGPEQVRGNIDYPDKITVQTRSSEDGTTWPGGWQVAHDPASYPDDGGATTSNFDIADGLRRFLQFRANLSTADTTVTPIVAEVKVYNVALDPDGNPATGTDGWITQTSQDDWEAGLVGTYTDTGMPANLQQVPDTNVRKYKGAVTLASEIGNLINATEERTANINVKKDTTQNPQNPALSHIWDQLYWILGTADWPQPRYKYRVKVILEELDSVPRWREPAIFTVNNAGIQNGVSYSPAGGDIRVVNGIGAFVPYKLIQSSPPNFTIMILATLPPKGSISYWIYYHQIDINGNRVADPGETYTKTSTVKWVDGLGPVGNYWSYATAPGDSRATIDNKQFWGTYQGQRSGGINFNWGGGTPGVGSCGSDYFSVGWRGYVYLNPDLSPASNWGFRIQRETTDAAASKQNGYMSLCLLGSLNATAPTPNSKNYSGIDLGAAFANRYLWGTQQVEQYNTTIDSTPFSLAGNRGMQLLQVNYAEYAENARAELYWTPPPAGPEVIIPATELYGFYSRIKGASTDGARPISLKSVGAEEQKQFQLIPGTTVELQTRISEDASTYDTYYSYSTTVDAEGYAVRDIPQANGNKRFIQARANLSTSDTSKTPILAEVGLYNRATGSFYKMTEQPDFEAYDTLDNIDSTSSPGNLTLIPGTGENLSVRIDTNNPSISVDTYKATIWDTIQWWIGYNAWRGENRGWRKLLTVKEPGATGTRDREYEPIDISGTLNAGRILKADCGDLLLTTEVGTEVAYQITVCTPATGVFTLRLPIMVGKNESVKYWLYYGDAAATTPFPYSKVTSVKFPHGDGIVRRRWGSDASTNSSSIGKPSSSYWSRDKLNTISQGDDSNYFSARFDGWIYASGTANLRVESNNHQQVWVNSSDKGLKTATISPDLSTDQNYANVLTAGFNRLTVDFGDYSGGVLLNAYGVDANGVSSAGLIPNDALYVSWTTNTSTAGAVHETPEFNEGAAGVKTWGTEQVKKDWVEDLQGRIIMDAQGSHDGTTWSGWTNIATYQPAQGSGQTDPPTALSLPAAVKGYRFLQWRVTLDTAGNLSYSPILSQVYIKSAVDGKVYETTSQTDFSNNVSFSNVDWSRRPGDLMLAEAATSNTNITTETFTSVDPNQFIKENTYKANVWTQLRWFIGYDNWGGGQRLYRRKITVSESPLNQRTALQEPIEISVSTTGGTVCANGNDIYLTSEGGTPLAYQLTQLPAAGTFKILFPVSVTRNSSTDYYVYFGDAACSYAAPYPPNVFSKATSPRFPDGSGVVKRNWANCNGCNNGIIEYGSYGGKTTVPTVNYTAPGEYFTAKFEGWIYHTIAANPGVRTNQDDHIKGYLNSVLGRDCVNCAGTPSDWGARTAGFNRITIETGNYIGGGNASLMWTSGTIIPESELYRRWTTNASAPGGGDDPTNLTYSLTALESRSPIMVKYGRTKIDTYGSHDGTTWSGATNQIDGQPLDNQPVWQNLSGTSGNYRFLKFVATLCANNDCVTTGSNSPIVAGIWFKHSDTKDYGADGQTGWKGTAGTPEAGAVVISNVDANSRPGDILIEGGTSLNTASSTSTNPVSGASYNYYSASIWTTIEWTKTTPGTTTIAIKTQGSNDNTNWYNTFGGTLGAWNTVAASGTNLDTTPAGAGRFRFIRFRAELSGGTDTPILHEVKILNSKQPAWYTTTTSTEWGINDSWTNVSWTTNEGDLMLALNAAGTNRVSSKLGPVAVSKTKDNTDANLWRQISYTGSNWATLEVQTANTFAWGAPTWNSGNIWAASPINMAAVNERYSRYYLAKTDRTTMATMSFVRLVHNDPVGDTNRDDDLDADFNAGSVGGGLEVRGDAIYAVRWDASSDATGAAQSLDLSTHNYRRKYTFGAKNETGIEPVEFTVNADAVYATQNFTVCRYDEGANTMAIVAHKFKRNSGNAHRLQIILTAANQVFYVYYGGARTSTNPYTKAHWNASYGTGTGIYGAHAHNEAAWFDIGTGRVAGDNLRAPAGGLSYLQADCFVCNASGNGGYFQDAWRGWVYTDTNTGLYVDTIDDNGDASVLQPGGTWSNGDWSAFFNTGGLAVTAQQWYFFEVRHKGYLGNDSVRFRGNINLPMPLSHLYAARHFDNWGWHDNDTTMPAPTEGAQLDKTWTFTSSKKTPPDRTDWFYIDASADLAYSYVSDMRIRFARLYLDNDDYVKIYDNYTGLQIGSTLTGQDLTNSWYPTSTTWLSAAAGFNYDVENLAIVYGYKYRGSGGVVGNEFSIDQVEVAPARRDTWQHSGTVNRGWRAIDGNAATQFDAGADQWLVIDLGASYALDSYKLTLSPTTDSYKWVVEVYKDGTTWTRVSNPYDKTNNDPESNFITGANLNQVDTFTRTNARLIRVKMVSDSWNTAIYEFNIYSNTYLTPGSLQKTPALTMLTDDTIISTYGRTARLYFDKFALDTGDSIQVLNADTGVVLNTFNPGDITAPAWTLWFGETGYGASPTPSTRTNGLKLLVRVNYRWTTKTNAGNYWGYSINQYEYYKLAIDEDGTFAAGVEPWKAINANAADWWDDGGTTGLDSGLIVDLGQEMQVFKYVITPNAAAGSVYRYRVEISLDKNAWTKVSDSYDATSTDPEFNSIGCPYTDTFAAQKARYVRLTIFNTVAPPNTQIKEFEIYPITYKAQGTLEKRLDQDFIPPSNQYLTVKGRSVRLTFDSFNLKKGDVAEKNDVLKIYNEDSGALLATYKWDALPPSPTPWFGYNTNTDPGNPSTLRAGVRLRLELTYAYSAQSPAGYSVSGYEVRKLAYEEDRSDQYIAPAGNPPWYAIDNNTGTVWDGVDNGSGKGLIIDLAKMKNLFKYEIVTNSTAIYRYRVDVSTDRTNWVRVSDYYDANGQDPESVGWPLSGPTYTDTFPQTDARYARLTLFSGPDVMIKEFRIYPTTYQATGTLVKQLPTPAKAWEFSVNGNLEGWTYNAQLTGVSVSGGTFIATSSGTDPFMYSEDNLGINGDEASFILIRMNVSAGTGGQVFFTTTADATWNEAKSRTFPLTTGSYKQYLIDMSDVPGWAGNTIKQIRVDPTNAATVANGVQIDYIRVLIPRKDTRIYPIGARDVRLHFSKLYLRGYDRLKIYNDRTTPPTLMLVYINNINLSAEHIEGNYPVTPNTANNMVDGAPTVGADASWNCLAAGPGFCTAWLSTIAANMPIEDGYGAMLRFELLYDYQAENAAWNGYTLDEYQAKLLIWDNDNNTDASWQVGSPLVNYTGTQRPSLAVDNNIATYWDGGAVPQRLIVDLGKTESINKINTEYYNSAGVYWRYEVRISIDGAEWTRVSQDNRLSQTITQPAGGYVDSFLAKEARYIMLRTQERFPAGTNVQVAELRIHKAMYANPGYGISYKVPSLKTGQQLQNYGFELNSGTTTPTFWAKTGAGTVEHTDDVRPGNASSKQSIKLTGVVDLTSDAIAVNPTDAVNAQFYEYYLSGWIKTATNTTAWLSIQWRDAGGVVIGVPDNVALNTSVTGAWEYFEGVYISPSNAATARVIISKPVAGVALFDDLRFSLADFQYDVKAIRAAAGQIKPHFSRFDMEGTAISGDEKLRDKLWMYNDSSGAIIDVDAAAGYQLSTSGEGLLPNPLTSAYDSSNMWLSYLGTADVRIVLRYNYTGLANKGYTIDQYKYRPRAYACHTNAGDNPDEAIDNISNDNASYWSPGTNTEDHWIEVDLGKVASLRKVSVVNQYSPSATYNYKVELSADGETYTNITNLTPTPSTPDTWATGIVSGTYTSSGFAQTFTRFDGQYVRVTYKLGTTIPKALEIRIWQTPYINPGSLTSEVLPPKRRYDNPTTTTENKTKGAANGTDSLTNTPVHRVLKVCGGAQPTCSPLYREYIDYIPTSTGIDWSPTDGAMEPTTGTTYNVTYEYGGISSDGAILAGTWNTTANVDTDWSFNNNAWAGGWVDANAGSVYQTINSDGTLNAGAQNASLNAGAWDGILHLYTPGNTYIHSVDKTGSGGLFDAGIPSLGTDYTVARHLQANFQISGAATNTAWAFMTRDGYNGTWRWKYSGTKAVGGGATPVFTSLVWDMLDGAGAGGTDWPWINVLPSTATNSTVNIPADTLGRQPPPDVTVVTRPTNEYQRLIVDNTPVLRIDISGATVWGSVKVTGVDAWGIGIDETVKFRANGTMNTRRKFARVDTVQTSGFTGGNITVQCLAFSGTIGRLAFRAHNSGARYVLIDSLRALPKVAHQKPYILLDGITIPAGAANPNNSANAVNWSGAGWVSLRFSKFNLYADDILQVWGKSSAIGGYDRLLRNFDKNSLPSAGGWTGNLGWGYDDFKIVLYHTPTGDSANCNPAVIIDQFVRSLNFYSSTVKNNDKPSYGAWRGADLDMETFWKAYTPYGTYKLPSWPVALNDYQGWYVDLNSIRDVNRAVVKWRSDVVAPGEFMIMGSSDCINFLPANVVAQGGNTYIFAAMQARCIGVVHPKDGANTSRQDVEIELAEFEIYPAGDYVSRGNYYSQPYAAGAHMQWIIPYPRDAYDMRVHFTKFQTQAGASADTSDIFRMYNDMTGWRWTGSWSAMSENTLIGTAYGNAVTAPASWLTSQAGNDCATLGNMRLDYTEPCIPDKIDITGFRTPWLLAGSDTKYPTCAALSGCFDTRNMGMRWKLLFTAPLGYKDQNSWEIDRYELYSIINPTLIQIDILARHGTGRDRRISSQTTKVQPPNLVFR